MSEKKVFYGGTILNSEDLLRENINNKIELEYYKIGTSNENNYLNESSVLYGIEVVKKEYLDDSNYTQEKSCIKYVSHNEKAIDEMLYKIRKYQVTPIALENVIDDLKKIIK